jgi:hypothetical protein
MKNVHFVKPAFEFFVFVPIEWDDFQQYFGGFIHKFHGEDLLADVVRIINRVNDFNFVPFLMHKDSRIVEYFQVMVENFQCFIGKMSLKHKLSLLSLFFVEDIAK